MFLVAHLNCMIYIVKILTGNCCFLIYFIELLTTTLRYFQKRNFFALGEKSAFFRYPNGFASYNLSSGIVM